MPGPGRHGGGPGGRPPGGRPGGMGGPGRMGPRGMGPGGPPPPPPGRGWRGPHRGGCLPGCLIYILGAGVVIALFASGIFSPL